MAMVLILGWQLGVGDVKTAFLHASLPPQEEFAVQPPPGYEQDPEVVWGGEESLVWLPTCTSTFPRMDGRTVASARLATQ